MFENNNPNKSGTENEDKLLELMILLGCQVVETRLATDGGAPLIAEDRQNQLRLPDFELVDSGIYVETKEKEPSQWAGPWRYAIRADRWDDYCEIADTIKPVALTIYDKSTGGWYRAMISDLDYDDRGKAATYDNDEMVWINRDRFDKLGIMPDHLTDDNDN